MPGAMPLAVLEVTRFQGRTLMGATSGELGYFSVMADENFFRASLDDDSPSESPMLDRELESSKQRGNHNFVKSLTWRSSKVSSG